MVPDGKVRRQDAGNREGLGHGKQHEGEIVAKTWLIYVSRALHR
jgi:hypothetical protein